MLNPALLQDCSTSSVQPSKVTWIGSEYTAFHSLKGVKSTLEFFKSKDVAGHWTCPPMLHQCFLLQSANPSYSGPRSTEGLGSFQKAGRLTSSLLPLSAGEIWAPEARVLEEERREHRRSTLQGGFSSRKLRKR